MYKSCSASVKSGDDLDDFLEDFLCFFFLDGLGTGVLWTDGVSVAVVEMEDSSSVASCGCGWGWEVPSSLSCRLSVLLVIICQAKLIRCACCGGLNLNNLFRYSVSSATTIAMRRGKRKEGRGKEEGEDLTFNH